MTWTHEIEPQSGHTTQILRALFLVNDKCSSEGLVWRPRRCVLMPYVPHLTAEGDNFCKLHPEHSQY